MQCITRVTGPCQPSLTLSFYADPSLFYVMFKTFVKTFERGLISINSWNASFVKKISKDTARIVSGEMIYPKIVIQYCESSVYSMIDNYSGSLGGEIFYVAIC